MHDIEYSTVAISRPAIVAATAAGGVIVLTWGTILDGRPPAFLMLLGIAAVVAIVIVALTRVIMPVPLRAGLILALIGSIIILVGRGDLFGAKAVASRMPGDGTSASSTDRGPANKVDPLARALNAVAGRRADGAQLSLVPGPQGDGGWAAMIDKAYAGALGGPAATHLTISGDVTTRDSDSGTTVTVTWRTTSGATSIECGHTAVSGSDRALIVEQVGEPFRSAVTRSLSLGTAACP